MPPAERDDPSAHRKFGASSRIAYGQSSGSSPKSSFSVRPTAASERTPFFVSVNFHAVSAPLSASVTFSPCCVHSQCVSAAAPNAQPTAATAAKAILISIT